MKHGQRFRAARHTPSQRLLSKLLREHDGRRRCRRRVPDVEDEESRREQSERTTSGLEPSRDCRPGTNDGVCNYSSEDPSTRGSHMTTVAWLVRETFSCLSGALVLSSFFFLPPRVSAHVNAPALVGMKLMCLAPSGFGILSRHWRDLRDSQKELSRR